jgi:hypothetical protein
MFPLWQHHEPHILEFCDDLDEFVNVRFLSLLTFMSCLRIFDLLDLTFERNLSDEYMVIHDYSILNLMITRENNVTHWRTYEKEHFYS